MDDFLSIALFIAKGISFTLTLVLFSFLIGITLGSLISIIRYKKMCGYKVLNMLISILRGTPLILQLSFIYFILPGLLCIKLSIFATGIFAFGLNSSAYVSEILRGGIESIPKGQFEAAKTLNIPAFHMWKDIILPQVFSRVLPSLVNENISLIKETAIISIIGDLILCAKLKLLLQKNLLISYLFRLRVSITIFSYVALKFLVKS